MRKSFAIDDPLSFPFAALKGWWAVPTLLRVQRCEGFVHAQIICY